jgi:hypothetical protein
MPIGAFRSIAIKMKLSLEFRSPIGVELRANAGHAHAQDVKFGACLFHVRSLVAQAGNSKPRIRIPDIRGNIANKAVCILANSGPAFSSPIS